MEAGIVRLRVRCTAPAGTGVMLDELVVEEEKPMRLSGVTTLQPVVPVLVGKSVNPVLGLEPDETGQLVLVNRDDDGRT